MAQCGSVNSRVVTKGLHISSLPVIDSIPRIHPLFNIFGKHFDTLPTDPNRPLNEIAGIRISRQGIELLSEYVEKRMDPRNRIYYWQGRDMQSFGDDPGIDGAALGQDFISITPVKCDMTDYSVLDDLRTWGLNKLKIVD